MGMVMTLEISNNMDKVYIFGTLRALGITWHMQFFPLPSLPKSLLSVSPFYLDFNYFNSNFVFFGKNHARYVAMAMDKTSYRQLSKIDSRSLYSQYDGKGYDPQNF